ncbi:hypothetical protein SAMN03159341_11660 [Paenibacillus sp. 1_12]|uniref:hypothetical protein n=1 Tax=Paenibacillus sp. 1_12 TaxID=1566278 RepID=UPI0008E38608|nr:hypothetical protein [Paenibacillus sp. 1_12]SFM09418.1 hypothetical protein SAMN03159341_11660 [Paenibacillus sp. 1_12]
MFAKIKSVLSDYFLPQQQGNFIYYRDEFSMYSYYNHTETYLLHDEVEMIDKSYVRPFVEKP